MQMKFTEVTNLVSKAVKFGQNTQPQRKQKKEEEKKGNKK